jgi:transposase-like protein
MIQETRTYRCRRCGSVDIVQNGRNRYGNQQYHCKACGAYGVLEPKVRYTEAQKEQILRAYPERVRLRGGPRLYGVSIGTVLPPVAETLRPAEGGDVLGVLWGGRTGRSRQVVACVVGDRREATGRRLWEAIPEAYRASGRPMLPSSPSRPTAPWTRNRASWLLSSAGITQSVSG